MFDDGEFGFMAGRRLIRWAVPVAVLATALVVPTLGARVAADPGDTLPPRTAEQLLVDVQKADVPGMSGTIVQRSELGLPTLSGITDGAGIGTMLAGEHRVLVWSSGDDKARVALLKDMGETGFIVDGSDAWQWSSADNTATHWDVSGKADHETKAPEDYTPEKAAKEVLAVLDEDSTVSTDGQANIAGRDAYDLTVKPNSADSLIDQVRVSIDAETSVVLGVQVYAKGQTNAAFEVAFSAVDFSVPAANNFTFTPPPGATVTEGPSTGSGNGKKGSGPSAEVAGTGWTSVVVAPIQNASADSGEFAQVIESLPKVSGDWGSGRLLKSALVSVLITDDGRVIAGAVRPEALYAAAR